MNIYYIYTSFFLTCFSCWTVAMLEHHLRGFLLNKTYPSTRYKRKWLKCPICKCWIKADIKIVQFINLESEKTKYYVSIFLAIKSANSCNRLSEKNDYTLWIKLLADQWTAWLFLGKKLPYTTLCSIMIESETVDHCTMSIMYLGFVKAFSKV